MDRRRREILAACIQEIESGSSDLEDCLRRYEGQGEELRSHLEHWLQLDNADKAERDQRALLAGQQTLLIAAANKKGGMKAMFKRWTTSAFARAGAALVAGALVLGGSAGASAAVGGPDPAGDALESIGVLPASEAGENRGGCIDRAPEPGDAESPAADNAVGCEP